MSPPKGERGKRLHARLWHRWPKLTSTRTTARHAWTKQALSLNIPQRAVFFLTMTNARPVHSTKTALLSSSPRCLTILDSLFDQRYTCCIDIRHSISLTSQFRSEVATNQMGWWVETSPKTASRINWFLIYAPSAAPPTITESRNSWLAQTRACR